MIRSFACAETEGIYHGRRSAKFPPDIQSTARRKLRMIQASVAINDLRSPPGNRLEQLKGNRAGQYSIRINGQWRVCFQWKENAAEDVEIVDYHG